MGGSLKTSASRGRHPSPGHSAGQAGGWSARWDRTPHGDDHPAVDEYQAQRRHAAFALESALMANNRWYPPVWETPGPRRPIWIRRWIVADRLGQAGDVTCQGCARSATGLQRAGPGRAWSNLLASDSRMSSAGRVDRSSATRCRPRSCSDSSTDLGTRHWCQAIMPSKTRRNRNGCWASSVPCQAGTFVDFGCGAGDLLREAAALGWRAHGVEFTPDVAAATSRATGYQVVPLSQVSRLPGQADVVHLGDVIEHLTDPDREFSVALSHASKRGPSPGAGSTGEQLDPVRGLAASGRLCPPDEGAVSTSDTRAAGHHWRSAHLLLEAWTHRATLRPVRGLVASPVEPWFLPAPPTLDRPLPLSTAVVIPPIPHAADVG